MSGFIAAGIVSLVVCLGPPCVVAAGSAEPGDQSEQPPGITRPWPCRIVVNPPLDRVVERAWEGSEAFRRQCRALADKGAIALLEAGSATSGYTGLTRFTFVDGVVVGRIRVPLNSDTLEYIAHELEHLLERAEGVDFVQASQRKGSGVWQVLNEDKFETQRAIDAGRQVARDVREGSHKARGPAMRH